MLELSIEKDIYTVSRLNRDVRLMLDEHFPPIWIEGEISNMAKPSSGHIYFTLKDEFAQIRCAMFRLRNNALNFTPSNGTHILACARISLYEERGEYQLIIDHMEESGDGALRRAFELLKTKLAAEGLFDEHHKKMLPKWPTCIGVVTSPTGAALHDILTILKKRLPCIPIIIYPTQVQGNQASQQIVKALNTANQRKECDVLIVARGGGSLEDLWPFNEEMVARAIFKSAIPVVSGVGHEIDFTIADFVADQRAPTPSAAAMLVTPNREECLEMIKHILMRLKHLIRMELKHTRTLLEGLIKRIQHPSQRLQQYKQQLDYYEQNLSRITSHLIKQKHGSLDQLTIKLYRHHPQSVIQQCATQCNSLHQQLLTGLQKRLNDYRQHLSSLERALNALNPHNTLERGYAIVTRGQKIIADVNQVSVDDDISVQLAKGFLDCTVNKLTVIPAKAGIHSNDNSKE